MGTWILLVAAGIAAEPRGYHEFQQEIVALFQRETRADEPAAQAAAVRELCALHRQIVSDARYATSDVLKEYRARIWSRLTKIKAEQKQQLTRVTRGGDRQALLDEVATIESADAISLAAADTLATSLSLLDATQGGAGPLLAYGGAAVPPNLSLELITLIERTINPAFWDVNGGPGSIVYYAPLQCLVVRATSEIHGHVGGAIGGLRAAGR